MMQGPMVPMMPDGWAEIYRRMAELGPVGQAGVATMVLAVVVLAVAGVAFAMERDRQAAGKAA